MPTELEVTAKGDSHAVNQAAISAQAKRPTASQLRLVQALKTAVTRIRDAPLAPVLIAVLTA